MLARVSKVARGACLTSSSRAFSVGAEQVAISMVAAPVHSTDIAKGSKGSEGLGRVTSIGSSVKNLAEGDWVLPKLGSSVFCKEAIFDSKSVTKVSVVLPFFLYVYA